MDDNLYTDDLHLPTLTAIMLGPRYLHIMLLGRKRANTVGITTWPKTNYKLF